MCAIRSDYLPSKTFCAICGHIIKEHQIAGNIEGIITHREPDGKLYVDPCDIYVCPEHLRVIQDHIKGGMEMAEKRSEGWDDPNC